MARRWRRWLLKQIHKCIALEKEQQEFRLRNWFDAELAKRPELKGRDL